MVKQYPPRGKRRAGMAKKILIVEDEENERILYAEELEKEGFEIKAVPDGTVAVALVEKEEFDLIILDLQMPGLDGIETLGKILRKKRNLPVIIYTAYPQYKDQFLTWAADAYLTKSSDLSLLKEKVASILK
jgi:DNA-binding response OmpR family regulator